MAPRILNFFFIAILLISVRSASGDTITLTSGRVVNGTILQTNEESMLVLADYGTAILPSKLISRIQIESSHRPVTFSTNTTSAENRLPEWKRVVSLLASQPWASGLRQIPATVITNGIMRNVPYVSFRCGVDYELNIYGDLDYPACIEVGIYRNLLTKGYARTNAIQLLSKCLLEEDALVLSTMDHAKDLKHKDTLTFEVTPATAPDAYGGWWISVYDEKTLDEARVSDDDLKQISVLNSEIIKSPSTNSTAPRPFSWNADDLKYARQPVAPIASTSSLPSSDSHGSGSVFVNGYYRKNGTYVHSYTRRR